MIKRCDICNIEFETINPRKKYCSPECGKQGAKIRDASRRGADIIKDCPICGERFEIGKNGALTKYCSQGCANEAIRIRNRDRMRAANPGWDEGTNKVCEWCGNSFVDESRSKHARFCSDECRQTWYSREIRGYGSREERKTILEKQKQERLEKLEEEKERQLSNLKCIECGSTFKGTRLNQEICSPECRNVRKNRQQRLSKDKRINETNNIDKDISVKALYERDKGICYICGGQCSFDDNYEVNGYFTAGPNYPSTDHLIPLARGGMHAWDNVKLAHHHCNGMKSDILPSELGLDVEINDAYALARKVSPHKKQVRQFTRDGKLIAVYESTAEAERQTGLRAKGIQNCARGERPSQGGYLWSY